MELLIFIGIIALSVMFPPMGIVLIFVFVGQVINLSRKKKRKESEKNERYREAVDKFNEGMHYYHITGATDQVTALGGDLELMPIAHYMFIRNDKLVFFPNISFGYFDGLNPLKVVGREIPVKAIQSFEKEGDFYTENQVSGGGGGGSSMLGAYLGEVSGGKDRHIIYSRRPVNLIQSKLIKHDSRSVTLRFRDESNLEHALKFNHGDYRLFQKLIPEKELELQYELDRQKILDEKVNREDKNVDVMDQIRKLGQLREEGLIDDTEFEDKKDELLGRL
ncbi:MAG: SHOCT domain-containing protein [Clostridia bacterium]|nr:SHOCT domain-containing protein [Clostridia bacterium]